MRFKEARLHAVSSRNMYFRAVVTSKKTIGDEVVSSPFGQIVDRLFTKCLNRLDLIGQSVGVRAEVSFIDRRAATLRLAGSKPISRSNTSREDRVTRIEYISWTG